MDGKTVVLSEACVLSGASVFVHLVHVKID